MLRIGPFAKACQVSERTLRFYEKEGLLRPARVDPENGYRYYDAGVLLRVHRILALRDLGLTLDEIRAVLNAGRATTHVLRGLLARKRVELEAFVRAEQERLCRVDARLSLLEQEGTMSGYEVVLKSVPATHVLGIRETIPNMEMLSEVLSRNFQTLIAHGEANGATFTGPCFEVWHNEEGKPFTGKDMDVECCLPVAVPVPGSDAVKVHELPGAETMACTVHHGPYNKLTEAHDAIHQWLRLNGYQITGADRCVYHEHHRNGDPDDNTAEIQYPVVRAG
jgi:DNA-binding transcriptional MerR regulator